MLRAHTIYLALLGVGQAAGLPSNGLPSKGRPAACPTVAPQKNIRTPRQELLHADELYRKGQLPAAERSYRGVLAARPTTSGVSVTTVCWPFMPAPADWIRPSRLVSSTSRGRGDSKTLRGSAN